MEGKYFVVYLLTNNSHRVFYTGITDDIKRRIPRHERGTFDEFTRKFRCSKLVWFEGSPTAELAAARKREIEAMSRNEKIALITATNPWWRNFADGWKTKPLHATVILDKPMLSAGMSPPSRLPEQELLNFDFEEPGDQ